MTDNNLNKGDINMSKNILIVVTTSERMIEDHKTGLWLSEFGEAYIEFSKVGYNITVASPLGGKTPIDARSLEGDTPQEILDTAKYLENTLKLDNIEDGSKFDAIFLSGGHGTMFDLPDNQKLQALIRELYEADKLIAAVCRGSAGLVGVTLPDGTPLVRGKNIAAFTDEEDRETTLDRFMPFLLETRLRELGANVVTTPNWTDNVQITGNLITGQNPQSTIGVAKKIIKYFS